MLHILLGHIPSFLPMEQVVEEIAGLSTSWTAL